MKRSWRPATQCIHAGYHPSAPREPIAPPLVHSATFRVDDDAYTARAAGRGAEVVTYSRETNPTTEIVEARLAALDGAEAALVFSSGMAALHALFVAFLRSGDRIVVSPSLYGGTTSLLGDLLPRLGVEVVHADFTDADSVRAAADGAAMLFCEVLSNPDLRVADLPAAGAVARDVGARLVVDATFASPAAARPIEQGAHLVMHSASKYLGGHSDLVAGVVCGSVADVEEVRGWRTRAGGCLDPAAAYLLDRGMRTLFLRVRAQSDNALALARALDEHSAVDRVLYPGLPQHPDHARAQELLDLPGGVLSFVHAGGDEAALRFVRALELVLEAPSLGGVETLVTLPAKMSHVHLSAEERAAAGVVPGFVRLSVGIEDPADLVADVLRALA